MHIITNETKLTKNNILIKVNSYYGVYLYYICSDKYDFYHDKAAANFLDMGLIDYRRLMKKSYKGFISGQGNICYDNLFLAKEAMELFISRVLIMEMINN